MRGAQGDTANELGSWGLTLVVQLCVLGSSHVQTSRNCTLYEGTQHEPELINFQ